MKNSFYYKSVRILLPLASLVTVTFSTLALANSPSVPFHKEDYSVKSGVQLNPSNTMQITKIIVVKADPGSPWMRVYFDSVQLSPGSYLLLESLSDGAQQRLDSEALKKWRNSSAYFNGDAVSITFYAAPGETGGSFSVGSITVGEFVSEQYQIQSQCGANDDRVASTDPAVGRIMPIGCTGWLVSNGATLTAGHCIDIGLDTLQFNVPASLPDGTTQNPPPQDQYPIEPIANIDFDYTIDQGDEAYGQDWAVFETFANTDTGRLAIHVQNAFYRMSRDLTTAIVSNVRITGYGVDFTPTGSTSNWNAQSQTLQTHTGPYLGETIESASDIYLAYTVDTEGANSGSPVIYEGVTPQLTMGIHTNGGCNGFGSNKGTSFENSQLEIAIRDFYGTSNVEYVDRIHVDYTAENGSIFRPHDTFLLGVADVVLRTGMPILSVVKGTYSETGGGNIILSDPMHIVAPVGAVIIK